MASLFGISSSTYLLKNLNEQGKCRGIKYLHELFNLK